MWPKITCSPSVGIPRPTLSLSTKIEVVLNKHLKSHVAKTDQWNANKHPKQNNNTWKWMNEWMKWMKWMS